MYCSENTTCLITVSRELALWFCRKLNQATQWYEFQRFSKFNMSWRSDSGRFTSRVNTMSQFHTVGKPYGCCERINSENIETAFRCDHTADAVDF